MSWAMAAIAAARLRSSEPSFWLTSAAARLITPSARTISIGMRSVPMRKLCKDRWVCAPQSLSAEIVKGPNESLSVRIFSDFLRALAMKFVQCRQCPIFSTHDCADLHDTYCEHEQRQTISSEIDQAGPPRRRH